MTSRRAQSGMTTDRWIMIALGILPLAITLVSGLWTIGAWFGGLQASFTQQIKEQVAPVAAKVDAVSNKVDSASKEAQAKVDALGAKVDASSALTQAKQDALSSKVDSNVADQQQFRASVQTGFTKLFDKQQQLGDQIQQEKIDRLTDGRKK